MSLSALQSAADSAGAVAETAIGDVASFCGDSCDVMGTLGSLDPEVGKIAKEAQDTTSKLLEPLSKIPDVLSGGIDQLKGKIAEEIPNFDINSPLSGIDIASFPPDLSARINFKVSQLQLRMSAVPALIEPKIAASLASLETGLDEAVSAIGESFNLSGPSTCPSVRQVTAGLPAGGSATIDAIKAGPAAALPEVPFAAAKSAAEGMLEKSGAALADTEEIPGTIQQQLQEAIESEPPGFGSGLPV